MKVSQMIYDLESQVRRLKSMKDVEQTEVFLQITDVDGYGGDIVHLTDFEILFDLQEDNNILVDVQFEKK